MKYEHISTLKRMIRMEEEYLYSLKRNYADLTKIQYSIKMLNHYKQTLISYQKHYNINLLLDKI